jgi:Cyclopropane fatty acid synthase and related methyltransferases
MSAPRETLEQTLRRLKQEREDADLRYNQALTELDRALAPPVGIPDVPSPIDDERRGPLNAAFTIVPAPPAATSWTQRKFVGLLWRTIAPYFERQQTFNSLLVEHINRNADTQRAAHARALDVSAALREQMDRLAAFQSRLMQLLQQVTAYVDTKDRDSAGGALVLNAALSDLAESQEKYRESFSAREQRHLARIAAVDELRTSVAVAQQAIVALKRHVEAAGPGSGSPGSGTPVPEGAFGASLDAYKYVGFEDQFRGSQEAIRARLESYVRFFESGSRTTGSGDVLDVGCGRGEFIDLLNARGIPARGIDLNHEMAAGCRARGLRVEEADAVGYLSTVPDASLRGIFAAQVVEHLDPAYLLKFLELAFVKLGAGGTLVLETINPACWMAFFESYIRDITHKWPLHPETLKYLVTASGFPTAEIEFRSPVAPHDRLQPLTLPEGSDLALRDVVETFNSNVEKLNARMFTFMDYAIVSRRTAITTAPNTRR